MRTVAKKFGTLALPLVLGTWFVVLLVGLGGCASPSQSESQQVFNQLVKAQGDQPTAAQRVEQVQAQTFQKQFAAQRVQAVIERWLEAQGGRRRLAQLQNLQCLMRVVDGFSHNFVRTVEIADGRYRYDLMIGADFNISGGYDGTLGWQDGSVLGIGIYPGLRGDPYWSLWCVRAVQVEKLFPMRRSLPDEQVNGQACSVLGLTPAGKSEERWFFDQESGQLVRVVRGTGAQEMSVTYGDFRAVAKIRLPYTITISNQGKTSAVYTIVRAQANATLKSVEFSPSDVVRQQAQEVDDLLKRNAGSGWQDGVETQSCLAHATIESAMNGVKTKLNVYRRKPGFVLVEKDSAGLGHSVSGYDGSVGWENSEILGSHVLKEGEVNDLLSLSWLGTDPYLRERFPLRAKMGKTTIDDRKAVTLRLRTFSGLNGKFYFDEENARLLRVEMEGNPALGAQALKLNYSDYRTVGAFTMPFRVVYETSGSQTVITCDSVELGVEMPDSLFKPRTDGD
jgi:hypothetical protein